MSDATAQPQEQDPNAPHFSIEKIYLKDLSVENPNAPQAYLWRESPTVEIGLEQDQGTIEDGFHTVTVKVTVELGRGPGNSRCGYRRRLPCAPR